MFPMKKKPAIDPMALEEEGLNDLKGFAEDGMAEELMARLGLKPPQEEGAEMDAQAAEGDELIDPPAVDDVPGMDPSSEAKGDGAEQIDPELLKKLLASMG